MSYKRPSRKTVVFLFTRILFAGLAYVFLLLLSVSLWKTLGEYCRRTTSSTVTLTSRKCQEFGLHFGGVASGSTTLSRCIPPGGRKRTAVMAPPIFFNEIFRVNTRNLQDVFDSSARFRVLEANKCTLIHIHFALLSAGQFSLIHLKLVGNSG